MEVGAWDGLATDARDRFERLEPLGRGSMGIVYRAHDRHLDVEVALKTFLVPEPEALYRLKQEFRSIADVLHPNLVELHELIVDDRQAFFTMELVPGQNFITHVRGSDGVVDLGRLHDVLRQLIDGLRAVHAAGKLHRDIKPTNILVTDRGRAVILDFGLVTALGIDSRHHGDGSGISGTLVYLSPEQLLGRPPQPADDWYSLGVMIFEALTGKLPVSETSLLDSARRQRRIEELLAAREDIPEHLRSAVLALLHRDPERRPRADELLGLLQLPTGRRVSGVSSAFGDGLFVGRVAELQHLHDALGRACDGQPGVAAVTGPSGIGKSELIRRFLADAGDRLPDLVTLSGRCHLQEVVPYNALDGIVDELSRVLFGLSQEDLAHVVPAHSRALLQLFPVLGRVPGLIGSSDLPMAIDAVAARRLAFAAFRELMQNLAALRPVVLWIDDAQWGDADSAALLAQLIQSSAPSALMVILSYRDESELRFVDDLQAVQPATTTIVLAPLGGDEMNDLARRLLPTTDLPSEPLRRLISECGGSPFLLGELASGLADPHTHALLDRGLAEVIDRRQRELPVAAQELLAFVATAARPLERSLALQLAGLGERGRPLVTNLAKSCLLRTSIVASQLAIEPYHDRVREALRGHLSVEKLLHCHTALADAYEMRGDCDPELLLLHCLGAGRTDRAAHWALEGAHRADAALAFSRAAQLYQQALDLLPPDARTWAVRAKLGHALGNSGRSRPAAEALAAAANELESHEPGHAEITVLRGAAAGQYLRAGAYPEGTRTARAVLSAIGLDLPHSPAAALARAMRERLRLIWRGMKFHVRADAPPAARLETLWDVGITLGAQDQTLGDAVAVRHCLEALDSGHPLHIVRALGFEIAKASQFGGTLMRRRGARLMAQMRTVVPQTGPEGLAFEQMVCGVVAYQNAAWAAAYTHCREAIAIQRRSVVGSHWGISSAQNFKLSALAHMGDLRRLGPELEEAIQEASERGDVHAAVAYHGGALTLHWLAQDRNDLARQHDDTAQRLWPKTDVALVAHYVYLIAAVTIELYEGNAWAAWERVLDWWPRLRRGLFFVMEGPYVDLLYLRGRAALAAAASPTITPDWPRQRLVADAEKCARALARNRRVLSAQPLSRLLAAAVADARGGDASDLYRAVWNACTTVDMHLHANAARARLAELAPHDRAEHEDAVGQWLERQRVRNPTALLRTFCPSVRRPT